MNMKYKTATERLKPALKTIGARWRNWIFGGEH